ncbi:hypothetical protein BaRGS_00001762 [Batillaria attramentaria]|uniref:Uncharacterized protein n=1 Tax=Batillaria attramentaria TaxID=370345 RepID=A0ABD0M6C2_9CAEN
MYQTDRMYQTLTEWTKLSQNVPHFYRMYQNLIERTKRPQTHQRQTNTDWFLAVPPRYKRLDGPTADMSSHGLRASFAKP